MLRKLCFALATILPLQGAGADELANDNPAAAVAEPTSPNSATSENKPLRDLYLLCTFYPKVGTCESVYRQALKDTSIPAAAVRDEYRGYVRYLYGSAALTESDRQYLKENDIRIPQDLSAANQSGLHNVINDETLDAHSRWAAVNNFLSRAVEAELYCGFNNCEDPNRQMAPPGT